MDKTNVVITLRKEVADEAAARTIVDAVKAKMADRPDVTVTAHYTTHVDIAAS